MEKATALKKLSEQIEKCKICKKDSIGIQVFGEGNVNAQIMFVGEAPGKNEAALGRPFIGRSGKLLRQTIRDAGLNEEDVYITSPVKYLPKRGTPSRTQINHAKPYFDKQVAIIKPKILVLLGKTAVFATLQKDIPVLTKHGEVIIKNDTTYFLTIHPAAALRFPKYKSILEDDFKKLKKLISSF